MADKEEIGKQIKEAFATAKDAFTESIVDMLLTQFKKGEVRSPSGAIEPALQAAQAIAKQGGTVDRDVLRSLAVEVGALKAKFDPSNKGTTDPAILAEFQKAMQALVASRLSPPAGSPGAPGTSGGTGTPSTALPVSPEKVEKTLHDLPERTADALAKAIRRLPPGLGEAPDIVGKAGTGTLTRDGATEIERKLTRAADALATAARAVPTPAPASPGAPTPPREPAYGEGGPYRQQQAGEPIGPYRAGDPDRKDRETLGRLSRPPDMSGATQGLLGAMGQFFPIFGQIAGFLAKGERLNAAWDKFQEEREHSKLVESGGAPAAYQEVVERMGARKEEAKRRGDLLSGHLTMQKADEQDAEARRRAELLARVSAGPPPPPPGPPPAVPPTPPPQPPPPPFSPPTAATPPPSPSPPPAALPSLTSPEGVGRIIPSERETTSLLSRGLPIEDRPQLPAQAPSILERPGLPKDEQQRPPSPAEASMRSPSGTGAPPSPPLTTPDPLHRDLASRPLAEWAIPPAALPAPPPPSLNVSDEMRKWLSLGKGPVDDRALMGLAKGESANDELSGKRMELLKHQQMKYPDEASEAMNMLAQAYERLQEQQKASAGPPTAVAPSPASTPDSASGERWAKVEAKLRAHQGGGAMGSAHAMPGAGAGVPPTHPMPEAGAGAPPGESSGWPGGASSTAPIAGAGAFRSEWTDRLLKEMVKALEELKDAVKEDRKSREGQSQGGQGSATATGSRQTPSSAGTAVGTTLGGVGSLPGGQAPAGMAGNAGVDKPALRTFRQRLGNILSGGKGGGE